MLPFPPRRILCASDLSDSADEAIRQSERWSRRHGSDLLLVHVIPDPVRSYPLFPQHHRSSYTEELPDLVSEAGRLLSERAAAATGLPASKLRTLVEIGKPYAAIIAAAERESADLVVVAGRGASGLQRVLLGSVAEQVVRYAPCPVLVAHPSPETGHVLAGTDFSDPSLPALAAGAIEAKARSARLTAFHAIANELPIPLVAFGLAAESLLTGMTEAERKRSQEAEEQLAASLARVGAQGDCRVGQGDPATALLRVADELPAELLVVGTHGRTGLRRLALGSVAERVARAAGVSVLVLRLTDPPTPGRH